MKKKQNNFFEQYRKQCEKCNHGRKVVIPSNDPLNGQYGSKIDILFVNERPGPTAVKTGFISFDNPGGSAKRFKWLFEKVFDIKYRKRIFITNAVLWCPKVKNYTNTNPTSLEVKCGSEMLLNQIRQIRPKIIVAIGRPALNALRHCSESIDALKDTRNRKFVDMAGRIITKTPYKIIPLFHTSSRNRGNRSKREQLKDWKKMKKNIKQ